MRSIRRPSPAMLVSFAAMFVALGGSSYAAAKITGGDIAHRTISGTNMKNHTLGPKKMKLDSLGGDQVNEAALGIVPNADTLDGIDSTGFMKSTTRLFEASADTVENFVSGATLVQLNQVPAGSYLVTAKLTYDNDGPAGGSETCTLEVPGDNDSTELYADNSEVLTLQKAVTAGAAFDPSVSCTGQGTDDILGKISLVAVRVD
jgi:hypothetical protein